MENAAVYPKLSEKELEKTRKTYRKAKEGRSKGFIFWLVMALGLVFLGFFMRSQDGASIENFSETFTVLGVLLVVLFIIGNFRSIKKYKAIKEEASKIDPALAAMLQQELEDEKAAAKQREIEERDRANAEEKAAAQVLRQEVKKLGKLIVKNIKEDMEDAWYDD